MAVRIALTVLKSRCSAGNGAVHVQQHIVKYVLLPVFVDGNGGRSVWGVDDRHTIGHTLVIYSILDDIGDINKFSWAVCLEGLPYRGELPFPMGLWLYHITAPRPANSLKCRPNAIPRGKSGLPLRSRSFMRTDCWDYKASSIAGSVEVCIRWAGRPRTAISTTAANPTAKIKTLCMLDDIIPIMAWRRGAAR